MASTTEKEVEVEVEEKQVSKILYHPTNGISDNHWAIKCEKEVLVGIIGGDAGCKVLVKVNPTDSRGYRVIAQLYSDEDMKSTLNRTWTFDEMHQVFRVGALVCEFFTKLQLVPQMYFAGNNSMELTGDGESILIGSKEPSMMHVHILGRGVNGKEYLPGVPFYNPPIGEEFNLKGNGDDQLGMKKRPWKPEERKTLIEALHIALWGWKLNK